MAKDLLELANEFNHSGEAFALATVVWRRAPSSGKVGYKALVTADGQVSGWVAGACTEPLVVRQSLKALADGEPRLMLIGAPEDLETRARDGLLTFPTSCASEGALEIYVEPHIPSPQLVVIGRSPVVDVMCSVANSLGWRTVLVDDEGGQLSDHGAADRVVGGLNLVEDAGVNSNSYIVVATLGHYDEDALEAALKTDAAYIGLVASRKRAGTVLDYLRENGIAEDDLNRIHAPAGLDLGRIKHEEMALAVIAEMVKVKAEKGNSGLSVGPMHPKTETGSSNGSNGAASPTVPIDVPKTASKPAPATAAKTVAEPGVPAAKAAHAAEAPEEAIDPVCKMTVTVKGARYKAEHDGSTYYFCCPACRKLFIANPQEYLTVKA